MNDEAKKDDVIANTAVCSLKGQAQYDFLIDYFRQIREEARASQTERFEKALQEMLVFFESDMWHSKSKEWKTEEDMIKYLRAHFEVCMKEALAQPSEDKHD